MFILTKWMCSFSYILQSSVLFMLLLFVEYCLFPVSITFLRQCNSEGFNPITCFPFPPRLPFLLYLRSGCLWHSQNLKNYSHWRSLPHHPLVLTTARAQQYSLLQVPGFSGSRLLTARTSRLLARAAVWRTSRTRLPSLQIMSGQRQKRRKRRHRKTKTSRRKAGTDLR